MLPPRRDVEALSLLSADHHLARIDDALTEQYAGVFSHETVAACLVESRPLLAATAKTNDHVAVLAERFARERLIAAARARGALVSEVPEVLFVCVHNAGR
ncbi:three-helix bundle dimerization domain-containing protein [Actinomycetospora soli]|uniref:three-helix bundle dimerization domain-containing protein n=1 Tax=Actinomycetospora soli TaxID=2893887 RepID=UPI001E3F2989|nr:hypothetical protein [Actinomycetospora soli]MCD2186839.1 hypothetical protein [Actinomycetospora soli]